MRYIIVTVFLLSAVIMGSAQAIDDSLPYTRLPSPVLQQIKKLGFSSRGLSVFVQEIGQDKPLLLISPDTPRNPASVIKLLTTAVALDELGPGYTWKTEVYTDGPVTDGVLKGNLYIKGYGDPYLTLEYFWRLLRALRTNGINHIKGDLIIDNSYFKPTRKDPAAFDDAPHRAYNVNPSALLINFQTIRFHFLPDRENNLLRIVALPNPETIKIENKVRLTRGRCRGWTRRVYMKVVHHMRRDRVRFTGYYPAACGDRQLYRVVTDSATYIYGVFRTLWKEQGGSLSGRLRMAPVPASARLVYTAHSLKLSDLVRGINKYSNNVMTRQLLLTLGAEKQGSPGTQRKGKKVINNWLRRHNLVYRELVLDNGTGLSRKARISARHLGSLLLLAYRKPTMPEFMSSLPVSAVDGTMRRRFNGTGLAGRLHMKTGTLDYVRSMAGYLMDKKGRRYVVVMLHNHRWAHTRAGERLQDSVLKWIYERE